MENKKFLKTDYPRGRTIEVYLDYARTGFTVPIAIGIILAGGTKNRNFLFNLPRNHQKFMGLVKIA